MALVFRGDRFLSVPEAAEHLGVTRLTVYRWLRGTRRSPEGISLDHARRTDIIRDTRTNQAYISEITVRRLKRLLRGARRSKRQRP